MMESYDIFQELLISIKKTKEAASKETSSSFGCLVQALGDLHKTLDQLDLSEDTLTEDFKEKIMSQRSLFINVKESRNSLGNSVNEELESEYDEYWKLKNQLRESL